MTEKPTFMSLFSGIGGFDLGLERAGFECIAQCDNDPFCNKVLAKHWPGVKRYDDIRSVGESTWRAQADGCASPVDDGWRQAGAGLPSRVDLICGGFPCQDLSVAGKRAGLDGARSGLWFEFHRILSELRPTFCLIENVPGLLSSNSGRDFGIVLRGLGELGYVVGWCVLDSQHFGVPQRRRRVYIIGGPSRASVQQILSLCESGDWNTQARRAEREDTPGPIGGGAYGTGRRTEDDPNLVLADTLRSHPRPGSNSLGNLANPLGAAETRFGGWRGDLDHDTYVPDVSPTLSRLDAKGPSSSVDQAAILAVIQDARGHDKAQNGLGIEASDVMYTLDGASQHAFAWEQRYVRNGRGAPSEVAPPLKARSGEDGRGSAPMVGVRRLTPVECERLQGFPDGWTQLDDKTPDGPRYKALGNAVTVPVIEYIGLRIREVLP